jgi:hypothetical protein
MRILPAKIYRIARVKARRFCRSIVLDFSYVHPRNTKIRAKTGRDKDAQSKMRTARWRFIRRRVTLVASALLVQRRTLDSSLIRQGLVL